jgi:NDP-sugar pyrophosphorylase family protein
VLPPICILAGGLGTRLGDITKTVPKPLVEVADEPFLVHQLRLLERHGANDVVLCVGHLGTDIEQVIGYQNAGLNIRYSYDGPGLDGTLGAIRRAQHLLGDRFLVLYGDTYLRIGYGRFATAWLESGMPAGMSVLRNENRWGPSNASFSGQRVVRYDKEAPTADMEWIDYGLGGLTIEALDLARPEERDLADLYRRLAKDSLLFGYEATERFFEIGTPEALAETDRMLRANS